MNLIDRLGLVIVHNKTGRRLTVSGNPGPGHGGGDQAFGSIPPGATGGGIDNPVTAYPTRGEAEYAVDPANFGPHRPLDPITDIDFYDDPASMPRSPNQCDTKLFGDDMGPDVDIGLDPATGTVFDDYNNLQIPDAVRRRVRERLFGY